MTMFFAKKLNKKGFTLAELLIVIAIIAVLVAIAIPIFNSSLNRAKEAVFNADKRAIKAGGVALILADPKVDLTAGEWYAKGTIDSTNGDITAIALDSTASSETTFDVSDYPYSSITVKIVDTDLTLSS